MLQKTPEKCFQKKSPCNELSKKEQETILFKELEKAREKNDEIQIKKITDEILMLNIRLPFFIINKFNLSLIHLNIDDLIQESTFSLYKAIEKFDYKLGYRFPTYAKYWIKRSIHRQIKTKERTIKLPEDTEQLITHYGRAKTNLTKKLNRKPTQEELSNELAWNTKKILGIKTIINRYSFIKSTEESTSNNNKITILDTISDNKQNNQLTNKDLLTLIKEIFKTSDLSNREKEILKLRFGLNETKESMFLEDVGETFGITKERVRQIQNVALQKLKKQFEKNGIILTDYI